MKALNAALIAFGVWLASTQAMAAVRRLEPGEVLKFVKSVNGQEFAGWFDPLDVLAVAEIESGFDPDARRFEPEIKWKLDGVEQQGDYSMGLMQVLYSTARDLGFRQGPAALYDPATNIRMGMRQLRWSHGYLEGRLGSPPDKGLWIGSYNAGVGNAMKGFTPEPYVNRWMEARERYGRNS